MSDKYSITITISRKRLKFALFAVIFLIVGILIGRFGLTYNLNTVSEDEAGKIVTEFITQSLQTPAILNGVMKDGELYRVSVTVENSPYTLYLSKDGKRLITQSIDLENPPILQPTPTIQQQAPTGEVIQQPQQIQQEPPRITNSSA